MDTIFMNSKKSKTFDSQRSFDDDQLLLDRLSTRS